VAAGAALLLVALFASVRLFHSVNREGAGAIPVPGFGLEVPPAALWAAGLFLMLAFVAFVFTFGLATGIAGVDGKVRALIDLLIDTQAELGKVSWPNREQLTRSTTAVLVSVVLIGLFLLVVDLLVGYAMRMMNVLPS
jgi:preprotein translocase subunit SecE